MRLHRFVPVIERLLAQVEIDEDGCWLWTGSLWRGGYGKMRAGGRGRRLVHRVAYELMVGPIPEGMQIDHRCHQLDTCSGGECKHRRCVNPDHLSPATQLENCAPDRSHAGSKRRAMTHCHRGHEFTDENTYFRRDRHGRMCRTCHRLNEEVRRARRASHVWS